MRWSELFEDDQMPKQKKPKARQPSTKPVRPAEVPTNVPVASGPIEGIPAEEIENWIESWDTDHELPAPKARRLE